MDATRLTIARLLVALATFAQVVGVPLHLAHFEHFEVGHSAQSHDVDHVHTGALGHSEHEDPDHPTHSVLDHLEQSIAPSPIELTFIDALVICEPSSPDSLSIRRTTAAQPDPPPPKPPPRRPERARAPPSLFV